MKQYHYDPVTLAYLGSTDAFPDPEEPGNFIIAGNAVVFAPAENLIPGDGQAIGILQDLSDWTVYENKIGKHYYDADGKEYTIVRLGEILPEWALSVPPLNAGDDKAARIAMANIRIVELIDLTDPDLVDPVDPANVAKLRAWRLYRNQLIALDVRVTPIVWPKVPQ